MEGLRDTSHGSIRLDVVVSAGLATLWSLFE
jgi:hypothetical protein